MTQSEDTTQIHVSKLCCHVAKKKLFDSTIHGCGMFLRSENWVIRTKWILFGLGSFSYLIYLVTTTLIEFHRDEVAVSISRHQELPATFPAVTVCNINPFNELYAYSYLINKTSDAACFKLTTGDAFSDCLNSTDTNSAFDEFIEKMKRVIANDDTLTAYDYYWYGYDLKTDMMVSCTFNGIKCTANDFKQFWNNNYGNCYTFNYATAPKYRITSAYGSDYGLKLELVVSMYSFKL